MMKMRDVKNEPLLVGTYSSHEQAEKGKEEELEQGTRDEPGAKRAMVRAYKKRGQRKKEKEREKE